MADLVQRIFLDPSRCIGCRSCVAACRECDTHKGESMIYIDYLERRHTVASSPTLCMHCEEPLAPCAQVCPGAGHPGQSRWRGAIGGRDALHLLRKLRLCLPIRRTQVQYRRSLHAKMQPVLRPHEPGQGANVRNRLSNAGHFLRHL